MSAASIQVSSMLQRIGVIAADIKLAHSVFAMPFALLAAFMAADAESRWTRFAGQLILIVAAMIFARTVAMLANRLLDRQIDARNPRTANRALPSGRMSVSLVLAALVFCAAVFVLICAGFGAFNGNWWPLILSLPVLAWISAYGLFKRFTSLAHLYLGSSLALSPIAAAIAIQPSSIVQQPAIWTLAAMVLCWVAGFDIIYALQDVEVDRREGLFSIPARLGERNAMWISRLLHAIAVACLVAALLLDTRLRLLFALGIVIVAALLLYEHLTVARWGATRMALTFFTLNGIISCVLGGLGVLDVLLL